MQGFLEGTRTFHAAEEDRVVDPEPFRRLGDVGRASVGGPLLARDPDDFQPTGPQPFLQLDQVRDRLHARLAPGPPEIDQDQVGVEVAEMNGLAFEVGQEKVFDPAVLGVIAAEGLQTPPPSKRCEPWTGEPSSGGVRLPSVSETVTTGSATGVPEPSSAPGVGDWRPLPARSVVSGRAGSASPVRGSMPVPGAARPTRARPPVPPGRLRGGTRRKVASGARAVPEAPPGGARPVRLESRGPAHPRRGRLGPSSPPAGGSGGASRSRAGGRGLTPSSS